MSSEYCLYRERDDLLSREVGEPRDDGLVRSHVLLLAGTDSHDFMVEGETKSISFMLE